MIEKHTSTTYTPPQNELEAVYAISRAVATISDSNESLDEIILLIRKVFIFDNIVIYIQLTDKSIEPIHARAIGRGRFLEADLVWGESVANESIKSEKIIKKIEELDNANFERTDNRHYLSMPLLFGSKIEGAIVFIRFGGPPYLPDHIRLAKFITDLIALHLRNRQLVDQIAELEAKRRLDNLQKDFISMISHELLTPLGFIKGYTTTLLRNDTSWDNKIRQEFLTIINREADHLRNLIINLLDSSRLETGHLKLNYQPIWLYTNLREICLRVKSHHTQSRIILDQSNGDIQIYVDPVRFAQVIENILNNAIKYAPNSPIKISIKKKREIVCIIIGDKGPGISQDHIEKIFRRFYRIPGKIEASIQGVGLGLYISQKIIQAHGGDLFAKSSPQNGTTFHIQLPYGDLRLSESID